VPKRKASKLIRIAEGTPPEDATLQFMMNCLLYSRIETGLESNTDEYDEDVNVYLAHLLNSFINPRYYQAARRYITEYDTEVTAQLERSRNVRMKYTIYKTNADFLLLSTGIFSGGDPEIHRPGSQPGHGREDRVERGKTYYHFAFSYSKRITPRSPSLTEVLAKLSRGFEKYVKILSHMRGEYFNLYERLTAGEEFHLHRSIDDAAQRENLRRTQDEFLDLYLSWKKEPNGVLIDRLQEVCERLRELDPTFRFEPRSLAAPRRKSSDGGCTR
jgi:hypothetical protein